MYFNIRNVSDVVKINGFIQGTVYVLQTKNNATFLQEMYSIETEEAIDASKISEITFWTDGDRMLK